MIAVGTRGKVSYVITGTTDRRVGFIESWASASLVCIRQADGSVIHVPKGNIRLEG